MEPFSFASSEALDLPVSIRIVGLEGDETPYLDSTLVTHAAIRHIGANTSAHSDLYVTAQVWAGSKPLTVPVQTAYRAFKAERRWNEWLTLPLRYAGLPGDACIAMTVWDVSPTGGVGGDGSSSNMGGARGHAIPFGGTTIPLFDGENQLHKGRYKCLVHRQAEADGYDNSSTPAFPKKAVRRRPVRGADADPTTDRTDRTDRADPDDPADDPLNDPDTPSAYDAAAAETERMDRLFKKHEMGEIPRVEWLDQLVFRGFERRSQPRASPSASASASASTAAGRRGGRFVLHVEFPRFDFPVVFVDHEYPPPAVSAVANLTASQSGVVLKPPPEVHFGPGIGEGAGAGPGLGRLMRVYDAEVGARDNPAESKHRRLVRTQHRHGALDKDLKPNAKNRDELNGIMAYPPTQVLTADEKDLVWKFRYHLTREKKAVTKFVKSVSWGDAAEAKQAVQVLRRWTSIDVDDALELLGPTFADRAVRAYAVARLRQADDSELLLYLLQLVQALKFGDREVKDTDRTGDVAAAAAADDDDDSSLAHFLIARAAGNLMLGNYLYWYLMVECDDHSAAQTAENRALYRRVAFEFMAALERRPGGAATRQTLKRQAEWVAVMAKIAGEVKEAHEPMAQRAARVRQFLGDARNELAVLDPPLPLPLDPSVAVVGAATGPDDVAVFKSSLHPIKVAFWTAGGSSSGSGGSSTSEPYPILFKMGDDLRQDQLVMQILTLMDQLLRKENLDLRLTPYKILATSSRMGLTQFVPSVSLQSLATQYRGAPNAALAYLRQHNADPDGPLGLQARTLDTFVRSCAGYCVITYILGVGDRHLDNLLLAPDGRFFHADFGFILGRDPKPFAPAMKLSKEMVEAMGGAGSEHYRQFKQYCFLAYSALRKSSNLILNLFSLMVDANIPDILWEPDKTVLKVQDRFHLELNEEDAMRHLERVIDDNLNAFVPVVIDRLHEFVQAFRA